MDFGFCRSSTTRWEKAVLMLRAPGAHCLLLTIELHPFGATATNLTAQIKPLCRYLNHSPQKRDTGSQACPRNFLDQMEPS